MVLAVALATAATDSVAQEARPDPVANLATLPKDIGGARARLREMLVQRVSPEEVVRRVLGDNPGINAAADAVGVAAAQVVVADAAFDPTLFVGLSYTNAFTKARRELIERDRDDELNENDLSQDELTAFEAENAQREAAGEDELTVQDFLCFPEVVIDGETFSNPDPRCFDAPTVFSSEIEKASFESRSTHTAVGSLGLGVVFPFGGSASTSFASTYRKLANHSTAGTPSLTSPAFPSGLTYDPYGWNDRPWWTSQFTVSAEMPLPFTKGFGFEGSSSYFTFQVAESNQRRSRWAEESTRNASLTRALFAYWDLVRSIDDLRTFADLRRTLSRRLQSQRRQLEAGLVTAYDVDQVDLQIANLDAQEELAWNFLLVNSNRLRSEIGGRDRQLLVPATTEAALVRVHAVEPADAFRIALDNNPDIKAQDEAHDLSKTTVTFRENQDLPDLSLAASFTVGQTDSAYGYDGPWASWRNIVRPDDSEFFIGVRYRLPLGMNQTEAQLSRARLEEQQAFDRSRQTRQQVVNGVDRALSDLRSAEAVVGQSAEDIRLANLAYEVAAVQRDEGLISEFELLNRYQDILLARRNRTAALVSYQKAYIQLLSAQGLVARVIGGGA